MDPDAANSLSADEQAGRAGSGATARGFAPPGWAVDVGRWSWILVGVVIVGVALFALFSAIYVLALATLFAVLFGGTFLPVVDWLAAHHIRRWIGAILVVVFLISLAAGIALVIVYGVVNQIPEMQVRLDDAAASIRKALDATSVPPSTVDKVKDGLSELLQNAATGAAGAIAGVVGGIATLIFGVFIGINIMVWLLTQGRQIGNWASRHAGRVPQPVAYAIFAGSARFFRDYIWGSTIIGLSPGDEPSGAVAETQTLPAGP